MPLSLSPEHDEAVLQKNEQYFFKKFQEILFEELPLLCSGDNS